MGELSIRDATDYSGRPGTDVALDDSLAQLLTDPEHFLIVERDDAFVQVAHPGRGGPGPAYIDGFQVEYKLHPDDTQWLAFTGDRQVVAAVVRGFADDGDAWRDALDWQPLDLETTAPERPDIPKLVKDFGDELTATPELAVFRFYRSRLELSRTDGDFTHLVRLHGRRRASAVSLEMHALVTSAQLRDWQVSRGRMQGHKSGRVAFCYVGYLTPQHRSNYPGVDVLNSRETALWVVPNLLHRFVLPFLDCFNSSRDFVRELPDAQLDLLFPVDVVELLVCQEDHEGLATYLERWRGISPQSYRVFTRRLNALVEGQEDNSRGLAAAAADAICEASLESLVPR